jgi:putative DNA primase/helicase
MVGGFSPESAYAPPGADPSQFARWRNRPVSSPPQEDPRAEFAVALAEAGLILKGLPAMDGKLHRVAVKGSRRGERDGAYVGHLDGHPAGFIENFKTGYRANWKSQTPRGGAPRHRRRNSAAHRRPA